MRSCLITCRFKVLIFLFADEWSFKTTTSSPNFPQSNGQVERTIQTLKRSLKQADYEGKDPYLSLLEYHHHHHHIYLFTK